MIRAVMFDAAHTLLDPHPPSARVYASFGVRHGYRVTEESLAASLKPLWWSLRAEKESRTMVSGTSEEFERAWWRGLVDRAFRDAGEDRGIGDECFQELYEHFGTGSAWRIFEDVRPTIEALKQRGVRLGVLSNFDSRLRQVLRGHSLEAEFHTLTISSEAGWEKPHPNIYKIALEASGMAPSETLMVGDDWHHDVEGPRAAGMESVWLRRSGPSDPRPSVPALTALLDLVPGPGGPRIA